MQNRPSEPSIWPVVKTHIVRRLVVLGVPVLRLGKVPIETKVDRDRHRYATPSEPSSNQVTGPDEITYIDRGPLHETVSVLKGERARVYSRGGPLLGIRWQYRR